MKTIVSILLLLVALWQMPNTSVSEILDHQYEDATDIILSYIILPDEVTTVDPEKIMPDEATTPEIITPAEITTQFPEINQLVEATSLPSDPSGICECAVFNTTAPTDEDIPFYIQHTLDVDCNTFGEENCVDYCPVLTISTIERPDILCNTTGYNTKIHASVHSRICGSSNWTYTNFTWPHIICCENDEAVDCKHEEEIPEIFTEIPPNEQ